MTDDCSASWFNLKNYEAFKTMPIEGWIWQIEQRVLYSKIVNGDYNCCKFPDEIKHESAQLKRSDSELRNISLMVTSHYPQVAAARIKSDNGGILLSPNNLSLR